MGIPVYTNSPITAAKADGITPKTADTPSSAPVTAPAPAPAATTLMPMLTSSFTPAQPGAAPVPAPTDSRGQPTRPATNYAPSPLTPTPTHGQQYDGPPPPQPGAVPQLPGHAPSKLPPPPKAGEKYVAPSESPEARPQAMPPQMSYGSLASTYQPPSKSTAQASTPSQTYPTPLAYHSPAVGSDEDRLEHPPGYHQNMNAANLRPDQVRAIQSQSGQGGEWHRAGTMNDGPEEESMWETAKSWAFSAGKKMAETEAEIWKRINGEK